jgi:hypothetical protein
MHLNNLNVATQVKLPVVKLIFVCFVENKIIFQMVAEK